jgi:protein-S-isoprenylcysteine O-methyltransferase Ste14
MNNNHPSFLKRLLVLTYGVFAYGVFFLTYCYAVGFVGGFGVPKHIDSPPIVPFSSALLVNAGLLGLFAIQHSVMARPRFKRWIEQYIPVAAERSTYTLIASVLLLALFYFWQPMGGTVWHVGSRWGQLALNAGMLFGFLVVLVTTFLINHFDLFGLRQVWLYFRNQPYRPLNFATPGPYRRVRHPLYVGWIIAFWSTPHMTVAHFVFAALTLAYILIAIRFEEKDLVDAHPEYARYRERTPMLIPNLSDSGETAGESAPARAKSS